MISSHRHHPTLGLSFSSLPLMSYYYQLLAKASL